MNVPKGRRLAICIYCNQKKPITDDHVVPDCLFPKPIPPEMPGLITVPACDECQLSLSKHQDYLRDMLASSHFASNNTSAKILLDGKVIRSIRGNRSTFARTTLSKSRWQPFYSPGGIYLQHLHTIPLEEDRLVFLFSMMVKGLYYSHFKKRLPDDCLISVHTTHPTRSVQAWNDFFQMGNVLGPFVWDDVFACMFIYAADEPTMTAWRFLFYTSTVLMITTRPPNYDADFKLIGNDESPQYP